MIRFIARGAYLLLVPQGRALISFLSGNNLMFETKLEEEIIRRLTELWIYMHGIIVGKLRRRPLFL